MTLKPLQAWTAKEERERIEKKVALDMDDDIDTYDLLFYAIIVPVLVFGIPLESFRVTNSRVLPLEEPSIVETKQTNRCYSHVYSIKM